MADVTISGLNSTTSPARSGVVPYSNSSTTTKLTITQIADLIVPIGSIIMWSGSVASIPSNWAFCNGTNGTPDLRNKFIVGAAIDNSGIANTNITGANTQTGGSKDAVVVSHTHNLANANTPINRAISISGSQEGKAFQYSDTGISPIQSSGVSGADKNLPPYFALAYIMRVS
jgi:microcystin-dependent protein